MIYLDNLLRSLSTQQVTYGLVFSVMNLVKGIVACKAALLRVGPGIGRHQGHLQACLRNRLEMQMLELCPTPSAFVEWGPGIQ